MSNNPKPQNSTAENTRDAYRGRLRQGILPFLLHEYVFSPFAMLKNHSTAKSAGHRDSSTPARTLASWRSGTLRGPNGNSDVGADPLPRPMEAPLPVKRGPGRPRKENGSVVRVKEAQGTPTVAHESVKKGPGRPRKAETDTVKLDRRGQPLAEVASPLAAKRGRPPNGEPFSPVKRGRPSAVVEVRRGPGRPRGQVIEEGIIARPPIQHKDRPTSPFTIRVEALANDTDRKSVVEIFKNWFPKIKKSLFREFIQPQQSQCTKRRHNFTGPFHWLIRDVETNTVICAASGMIHSKQFCNSFMEILYFATAASHLNFGLGRLLNASLQKFAYNAGCEYVLVQASRQAVPFWTKPGIGYSNISRDLMAKFKHFYEMRSIQLSDTVLLTWTVDEPSQAIGDATQSLSKIVRLEGGI